MIKDSKPYRILVIEDNPGDFVLVEDFLTDKIISPLIVQAQNFEKAFSILSASHHSFDVILLDLSLPDKSGQELVTEMLEIAASCPIIILTGYTDIDFSIRSISQGILDYLLKDELNATTLYKSILYAIERKKIISELKASEKRYHDLFRLSPQPMWVFNLETFRFMQVNKAAIQHYGYTEEEFLNMTIMDIRPSEEIEKTKRAIARQKENPDGVYQGAFRHLKRAGEIIDVEIYSSPLIINEEICKSVIAIDVTEKNLFELKLTKAIIKSQEDERYEIGGELHDNVCQILATSLLSLGMIKESLGPAALTWFNQCEGYITLASDEIRNLSHRLAPTFFTEISLEEAFGLLLKSFNIGDKYKISIHFDPWIKEYTISLELQLNLYRVLQEQLRNILKYANASEIKVDLTLVNNKLTMRVADDGVGFNQNLVKCGIGLANMKRRATLFFGKLNVESAPGKGCKITVTIPFLQAVQAT
ncbi:MAG: PAS domain S-box protein [Ferruginibacter sp.]